MNLIAFILIIVIIVFVIFYRSGSGANAYKFVSKQANGLYGKFAPYSYQQIREKVRELAKV